MKVWQNYAVIAFLSLLIINEKKIAREGERMETELKFDWIKIVSSCDEPMIVNKSQIRVQWSRPFIHKIIAKGYRL